MGSTQVAAKGHVQGGEISRNLTVLLADADPAARHVLRRVLLREFKSVVIEADNGIAALEGLDTGTVDALVLDLKIPTLGGLDVLRDIRTSPRLHMLPVVVVTEQKDEIKVKEALSLGVADYVLKDQHQAVIVERLRRVFSSGRHIMPANTPAAARRAVAAMPTTFNVLVVDEDPDFRHFCNEVFQAKYEVTTTASAAHAMSLSLLQAPSAILVGTAIGTMSQETFVRRLRQIESLNDTCIIGVVPKAHLQDAMKSDLFDKVVVRSFVPETFMQTFDMVVRPPGVLAKVLAAVSGFRANAISSVEQVFGMMLGTEVNVLEEVPVITTGVGVGVGVALAEQSSELLVGASVTEETGLALAARMLQSAPEDLPEDAATSALAEILNMVAGRILHGLSNAGLRAQIGLPDIGSPKQPDRDAIMMGFEFESLTGEPKSFAFSISEKDSSGGAKTD